MPRVLVVSVDRVAPEMAGPGIRALELARALARRHDVALAAPAGSSSVEDAVEMRFYDPERPRRLRRASTLTTSSSRRPFLPPRPRVCVHVG